MSYSDSDEHSGSEAGENRNSSVNTRVIKQHRDGSKELKGVFREDYESDSNQKPRRADKTHYQLNEQRVNNGKHNKGSYHGSESDSFDSDSSELADVSHDQDSREYRKKDRKISSYDNLKDTYKNEARQTDRDDIMNSHEDRKSKKTSDFNETLTVDDNRESRKMNQVRTRRPEERNGEDQSDYKRDVSPGRNRNLSPERGRDVSPGRRRDVSPGRRRRETTRNIEKPNVIITEADVHVDSDEQENKRKERSDKEEYERRRRKEKSDSHLHVAHRNEPEMYDKPGRTRSEPRIAGKHGKDEVNRADKREYRRNDESQKKEIVENEAHTNDSNDEMWEKDNNFEYQDRNTHNRGNRDQNDRLEHDQKEITDNESRSRRNREHNQAEVTEDESRSTARNESKSRSGNNKSNDKSSRKEYENKAGDFKRDRQKEELQGKKYNEHEDEPMNRSRNNKFEGDNSSRKEYEAKKDKRDGHNREYQDNRASDHDKVGLVERDTRGNNSRRREHLHKKEVSYEDETDGGQYDNSAVKNEKIKRKEPNTRYYTPQMKRKQNKGRQGALLSLVSEDDLSDSGSRQKGFEKSRNTEAAFSPVGKAKSMKDVRTSREPSMDNEFSMPHNKMGSFQDFKPMAKATSVSRISNIHGKFITTCIFYP